MMNVFKWGSCALALMAGLPTAFTQQQNAAQVKEKLIIIDEKLSLTELQSINLDIPMGSFEVMETPELKTLSQTLNSLERIENLDINLDIKVAENLDVGEEVILFVESKTKDEKPFLGVGIENADQAVKVTAVYKGSAAEAAGLQAGDLISSINGKATTSVQTLQEAIRQQKKGDQINIRYLRNHQAQTTIATLQTQEAEQFVVKRHSTQKQEDFRRGRSHHEYDYAYRHHNKDNFDACKALDKLQSAPFIGVFIDVDEAQDGANVSSVIEGTDAPNSDLQAGDQILKINRFKVKDFETLRAALANFEPGDRVRIQYARNGVKAKTSLTLSSMGDRYPYKVMKLEQLCATQNKAEEQPAKVDPALTEEELPKIEQPQLDVFPNPVEDLVNIQFEGGISSTTQVLVLSADGKELLRRQVDENPTEFNLQLDLSELPAGFYLISVQQGEQITSKPISVK